MNDNALLGLTDRKDDTVAVSIAANVDDVAYTPGLGWLTWDGRRWEVDSRESLCAQRAVMDWVRPHVRDAVMRCLPAQASSFLALLQQPRLESLMKALARQVRVPVEEWDAHPHLLNTPTGVVDLHDGTLHPHQKALRLTRMTSVGYVAGATHGDWEQALTCQPDVDSRAWLQATLGSGCWGVQRGDTLALLTGHGANGKSTVTGACVKALGDYAAVVDRSVIVGKGHPEHRATLRGRRLTLVEELEDGHRLNMAEVKGLLGTETIVARHLYQSPITFHAQFTLAVTTNYQPQVPDTDHGTWRRLRRLDFPVRYEGADMDLGLRARLQREQAQQEAVLAWMVQGAMQAVPEPSPDMDVAMEEWRAEADTVAAFVREHCLVEPGTTTTRSDLYAAFSLYLVGAGQPSWSQRTFTSRWRVHPYVEAMGLEEVAVQGARGYRGLLLVPPINPTGLTTWSAR